MLLGEFAELERQEIFFSLPDHLNDPLEGFKNVVWSGPAILWRNLLNHYLLCLVEAASLAMLQGDAFEPERLTNLVKKTDEDLPEAPIRAILAQVRREFFAHEAIAYFVDQAAKLELKLNQDGLRAYLRSLQPMALDALFRTFAAHGLPLVSPTFDMEDIPTDLTKNLRKMLPAHAQAQVNGTADVILKSGEMAVLQLNLIQDVSKPAAPERANWLFLTRDFPRFYVDALPKLLFPDWATACFVTDPEDPAMWGVYGDGHRGACLIFRPTNDAGGKPTLTLDWTVGLSRGVDEPLPIHQTMSLPFTPVRYANDYPEIDFFTTLGVLVRSKLRDFWYRAEDGTVSPYGDAILSESAEWRSAYWARHGLTTTTKLPQWEREHENRLVLTTNFVAHGDAGTRKLRYRFSDLSGIAFGMKMPHTEKLEIMRIIERKAVAEGRQDFDFFQAQHDNRTGNIVLNHLGLLKIKS
jgi:hypothetical protein